MTKLETIREKVDRHEMPSWHEIRWLIGKLERARSLVDQQAEDWGLWAVPAQGTQPIAEACLQSALRALHAEIESLMGEQ